MSDDRPSIAALQRDVEALPASPWEGGRQGWIKAPNPAGSPGSTRSPARAHGSDWYDEEANAKRIAALRNAAPVLLEIAAAALVRRDTECSCGAQLGCFPYCAREIAEQALLAALSKVRP